MARERLERIELQRVTRIGSFENDHGSECLQLLERRIELCASLARGRYRRVQLPFYGTAVGATFYVTNLRVTTSPPPELAILDVPTDGQVGVRLDSLLCQS
jgi:hypothetical protein